MKKYLLTFIFFICFSFSCEQEEETSQDPNQDPIETVENSASFDFSSSDQLEDLPSYGTDPSYISNGTLVSPVQTGEHKGLGKKFYFANHGDGVEPDRASMSFDLSFDSNFQKDGEALEVGKFPGFEGIYDESAGWGGRQVIDQNSWSVRIGHAGEDSSGNVPIALYVYHPGMASQYGTVANPNFTLEKNRVYKIALVVKLNDVGSSNGQLILSVDDQEVYNNSEWLLRNDSSVHIISTWLDVYIGGVTPAKYDTDVTIDNLEIDW